MAVSTKIRITREKLAEFVPDHDTIRQMEILIAIVNSLEVIVRQTHGLLDEDGLPYETLEEMITRLTP